MRIKKFRQSSSLFIGKNAKHSSKCRLRHFFINLLGILCALAIAFSGMFLVQGRLIGEQDRLLSGGGLVELPQIETAGAVEVGDAFGLNQLAEEELLQLVYSVEQKGEIRPHEPLQGQLTMIQAMDCGVVWLEEFFLPHFGLYDLLSGEYRTSCYLWAPETAGQDIEAAPWLSCWTVSVSNRNIDATLTLSAVSGQVLDASVSCSAPVSYQDGDSLMTLLGDYAFSFDLEEDYTLIYGGETDSGAKKLPWYQSIGTEGLYAAIQADNIVVSVADSDTYPLYQEFFNVHLYLCSKSFVAPFVH